MSRLLISDFLKKRKLSKDMKCLFEKREEMLEKEISSPSLETIVWEATRRCDIKCKHCGSSVEDSNPMNELSTAQVEHVFNKLHEAFNLKSLTAVSITGGEPLVRNDIVHLIQHIKNLGSRQIVIHTNGRRASKEPDLIDKICYSGVSGVGINLDGLEQTHNCIRQSSDSFNDSINAFNKAKSCCVDTMITTVVNKQNITELFELKEFIQVLNPTKWRLVPMEPIGRAKKSFSDNLLDNEDMTALIQFLLIARKEIQCPSIELGCGQWLGQKLEGLIRPYIWYCIAGLSVLGIMHDGSIGACNNISPKQYVGNILTDNIKEIWDNSFKQYRSREWMKTGECYECQDWNNCRGGEMHLRSDDGDRLGRCFFKWLSESV